MSKNIKFYRFDKLLFKYLKKKQKEMNFYVTKIFIKKKTILIIFSFSLFYHFIIKFIILY